MASQSKWKVKSEVDELEIQGRFRGLDLTVRTKFKSVANEGKERVECKTVLSEREISKFKINNIDRGPIVSKRVGLYWSRMFEEWDIWLSEYADSELILYM